MTGDTVALLLIGVGGVLSPILTMFWPRFFGLIGAILLTGAGIFFMVQGKSAFTETTAAIYFVGAFILSGLIAVVRAIEAWGDSDD